MDQQTTACRRLRTAWLVLSATWLAFIAWRTSNGWPSMPLDMGGADAETNAAYTAAQIQHATTAAALALAAPLMTWLLLKAACRARRM